MGLDFSVSHGLKGGHPETEGLSESREVITTEEHAHRVELDLTRIEFSLSRTFDETWDAVLRVPWFSKFQTAETVFPHHISDEDREAAVRSGYSHHRTATYEGIGDVELSGGWRRRGILTDNDTFRFGLGLFLPFGDTEEDPLSAGDAGLEHLHVQFGNGTFDPLVEIYYGLPLSDGFTFSVFGRGRFPLYASNKGYLGSVEGSLAPRLTWQPHRRLTLFTGASADYYGYSEWYGRRDPNSGQLNINASLGTGWQVNDRLHAAFTAQLPVYTKTFSGEDSLDPAPTFSLSASWKF